MARKHPDAEAVTIMGYAGFLPSVPWVVAIFLSLALFSGNAVEPASDQESKSAGELAKAASNDRWTLPIGGGGGKIIKLGKLPINLQLQAFWNVVTPQRGGADWQLRFQVQFLFPR